MVARAVDRERRALQLAEDFGHVTDVVPFPLPM